MLNRKVRHSLILINLILFLPHLANANTPYYGANISYIAIAKEPSNLHGMQMMINYDPQRFQWRQFNVYFDGGFSHFYVNNTAHNSSISIYSAAPVVRYTFKKHGPIHPYLELSIGLAYLTQTRLDDRNLGMHFAFQDRAGIGVFLGSAENVSVGIHVVHYSNARLASHNSGITAPLIIDLGYRFN